MCLWTGINTSLFLCKLCIIVSNSFCYMHCISPVSSQLCMCVCHIRPTVQPEHLQIPSVFCICDEREWCTDYGTPNCVLVYFNSVIKTRQTMLLYAYFTPKVYFKRKFNHYQSFLYEWRLTARTIRIFRIGPSIRIESRIGRTIRNRIESRSFAGP